MNPILSVIIPVYNVEKYLAECLDSALAQTLKDIEIICVDDGSTDGSAAILDDYARRDPRIRVIHKANAGFGHTMNCGLHVATGKYVAFLESDDFIVPEAYEELVARAEVSGADIVKGDKYDIFGDAPNYEKQIVATCCSRGWNSFYNRNLNPRETPVVFDFNMLNQLGVFRRAFLAEHKIMHNETPGASYQDNGFWFQTFCWAKSVHFVDKPYYCHRRGRPDSSMTLIHKFEKAACIRDEYRFIWSFLEAHQDELLWAIPIYFHQMFPAFWYRYRQVDESSKERFLMEVIREELLRCEASPLWTDAALTPTERNRWWQIVESPKAVSAARSRVHPIRLNLLSRMTECYCDEGFWYTFKRVLALGRR